MSMRLAVGSSKQCARVSEFIGSPPKPLYLSAV